MFFFSSRRRHTRWPRDWSSDVCSSDLELLDAHEAIGGLIGAMEQSLFYEQHVQDPELKTMLQNHKAFKTQLYNTIVDTLQSGQDPSTPTQSYKMNESNDVVYGMMPSQPKTPAQTINEINDECIRSEERRV